MSERSDRDPDDLDDWLAETPDEAAGDADDAGEATPPGGEAGVPLAEETSEEGEGTAEEREQRRQERDARRRERHGVGEAGAAAAGVGASVRRLFSRSGGEEAESDPGEAAEDHFGSTTAEGEAGDLGDLGPGARTHAPAGEGRRAARGGGGRRSGTYARRRLMAGGAILGAIALLVIVVIVIGSRGGSTDTAAPVAAPTIDVTIPEGLSRDQIADVAKESGVKGNYKADSKSSNKINLKKYGAEGAKTLEGFLFPATYELNEGGNARQLVTRQLETFEERIKDVSMKFARSKNLTTYDVLKIASMIEREIMVPKERRLASAVIYNRLAAGQPLGIDSTIRFEDSNYNEQLTQSRLQKDTPFNTRIQTGLPPTPIGNPGLASIEAAANPKRNDLRFFVVKPGTCGEHVFTSSEEEFFQAEAEYQAALQEEGGSPTDCPE